eukprot:SM000017S02847  [mRNA]  locus=s17:597327:598523:+ [translate_table: standard]
MNKSILDFPLRPRSKPVAEDQDGEAGVPVEHEKSRTKQAMAFLARAVRQACKLPGLLTRTAGELLLSLLGFAAAVVALRTDFPFSSQIYCVPLEKQKGLLGLTAELG